MAMRGGAKLNAMARNFVCPETEALCEEPGCTRDRCGLAIDLARRSEDARWNYLREHPERITPADLFDD
jgi:hypothetical protein